MEAVREVRAARLWTGHVLDLNAIRGFMEPCVDVQKTWNNIHETYLTFSVYMEGDTTIVIKERLNGETMLTCGDEKGSLVRVTDPRDICGSMKGWAMDDGTFTVSPQMDKERIPQFQEFWKNYEALKALWEKPKGSGPFLG
jgi:hypothetical protein